MNIVQQLRVAQNKEMLLSLLNEVKAQYALPQEEAVGIGLAQIDEHGLVLNAAFPFIDESQEIATLIRAMLFERYANHPDPSLFLPSQNLVRSISRDFGTLEIDSLEAIVHAFEKFWYTDAVDRIRSVIEAAKRIKPVDGIIKPVAVFWDNLQTPPNTAIEGFLYLHLLGNSPMSGSAFSVAHLESLFVPIVLTKEAGAIGCERFDAKHLEYMEKNSGNCLTVIPKYGFIGRQWKI